MREHWGRKGKKNSKKEKAERLRNKKLVKKYYFLKPTPWYKPKRNRRLPKYDYSYIEWYGWPQGWNVAFADMFLEELGAEIKRIGQKNFRIDQIKEKFGEARCYTSGTSDKANQIINKYEYISTNICWDCGKPDVPMIDDGWMHPICLECYKKAERKRDEFYKEHHPEYVLPTDDEYALKYQKVIIDKPDENGEYKIADSYTIRRFSKDGNIDITYSIKDTADKVRERWERRKANYEKRVHRR